MLQNDFDLGRNQQVYLETVVAQEFYFQIPIKRLRMLKNLLQKDGQYVS